MSHLMTAWAVTSLAVGQVATDAPWEARVALSEAEFRKQLDTMPAQGYRPAILNAYAVGRDDRYAVVWEKRNGPAWVVRHRMTAAQFDQNLRDFAAAGYRLTAVSGYTLDGAEQYLARWEKRDGPDWLEKHGLTATQYTQALDALRAKGYRPVHISVHAVNQDARYAAIWERHRADDWVARQGLSNSDYQKAFDDLLAQGYRPVCVSGCGFSDGDRYSAVWLKRPGKHWVARHGQSAAYFEKVRDAARAQGYRPTWISGYALGEADRYASLWERPDDPRPEPGMGTAPVPAAGRLARHGAEADAPDSVYLRRDGRAGSVSDRRTRSTPGADAPGSARREDGRRDSA